MSASIPERLRRRVRLWQHHYPGEMWQRVMHRDLAAHTLALAAQQVLCMGPLLVAASPITRGLGLGTVTELLSELFGLDENGSAALDSLFRPTGHVDSRTLLISALVSLTFGISVASTTQRMLETMWDVDRAPLKTMWRQVLWLVVLLPALAVAMWLAHLLRGPSWEDWLTLALVAVAMGVAAGLLMWWTQWLLLVGRISWRRLLPGSAAIAVGVAVLVAGSALFIPGEIVDQSEKYGPIGAGFMIAGWIVALTGIIATGVLAGAVLDERRIKLEERRASLTSHRPQGRFTARRRQGPSAPRREGTRSVVSGQSSGPLTSARSSSDESSRSSDTSPKRGRAGGRSRRRYRRPDGESG